MGGLYDRQSTDVDGHTVENEDLVNVPNWLPLTFRIDDDTEWFGDGCTEFLLHHQELDMRRGVLTRQVRLRDAHGRVSRVTQRRFVSMHDPHALALETTIVAENWSGRLAIRSGLDGRVTNACVARYHDLERRHLSHPITGQGEDSVWLSATTSGSGVDVVLAARTRVVDRQAGASVETADGFIGQVLATDMQRGDVVVAEKVVSLSRDRGIAEPVHTAREHTRRLESFDRLLDRHVLAWHQLWRRSRFDVGDADVQPTLNLYAFHPVADTFAAHRGTRRRCAGSRPAR